ncbi:hypothetical protein [Candidatus Enterovibrio escicola]|uniref:hypothetical protein n=1 Tax=Candidatus Enterovibrio escicola TaxID=1927127 RepID=UPI001680B5EE|nr:hypothetical protein [Candidatus Enterovibrio escacola]
MNNLDVLSTDIDDFYQVFLSVWNKYRISGIKTRNKPSPFNELNSDDYCIFPSISVS